MNERHAAYKFTMRITTMCGLSNSAENPRLGQAYPAINASNIVAIVHSHPRESGPGFENVTDINELSPLDYGNTMPSHPNIAAGPNDWDNARSFLLANGRDSVADVSHYILGPDGVLRQYNYSDGHPAESTEQHSLINAAESNAAGECDE